MVTAVNTAYPNATFYGAGHGDQKWSGEPNPEFYIQAISDMIYQMLAIRGSKLLRHVRVEPVTGERAGFRRTHPGSASVKTSRHKMQIPKHAYDLLQDTADAATYSQIFEPFDEPKADMRWFWPTIYKYNPLIGTKWDPLFAPVTPENRWVEEGVGAIGRQLDRNIVAGYHGTMIQGHGTLEGAAHGASSAAFTSVEWASSNDDCYIYPANGFGLTREKIAAVASEMDNRGIPATGRKWVISAKQKYDIMNSDSFVSSDFRSVKPIENNEIGPLFGFEWVVLGNEIGVDGEEAILPTVSGTTDIRRTFAYHESTMKHGMWQNPAPRMYELPQQDFDKAILITACGGTVRMEERTMFEVECVETAAAA